MSEEIKRYQIMLIQCEADFVMVQKERDAYLKIIARLKRTSVNRARKWANNQAAADRACWEYLFSINVWKPSK